MATVGRPEAVLELAPAARAKDAPLIDLNPIGRRQNRKYRAKVRLLPSQRNWLDAWENEGLGEHGGRYCGYASVDSIDTALRRACALPTVDLPKLSVKGFRHRVTSVLRASRSPRVPAEQISYQLGHRRLDQRTTRNYGEYDPDYLAEAASVLEAWVKGVLALAAKSHRNPTRRRSAASKAA